MLSTLAAVLGKVATDEVVSPEVRELAKRRRTEYEHGLADLSRPVFRATRAARTTLGRARRRLRPSAFWYDEPPAEITEAFGDLESL